MSRKVAFVNDMILKTLNQHQQTVSPDVKKAANLDDDISEVLKRRDVNVYDKAKLYSQVLQQYLYAKETIHPTQAPPPVVIDTKSSPSLYSDDSIIDTVPKQYKTRAANMLRFLHKNDQIQWEEDGRVNYKGQPIPGSNITDLINDQMRSRKNINPHGWQQFSSALKLMNVPTDLIGNKRRLESSSPNTTIPRKRLHSSKSRLPKSKWLTNLNG